ncbi:DNA helicase IV [Salipiger mucosus DSM 16094]|uniref:DNA helicase IV n=1 Tax=Salipiger mucosus DSM 16094 TaxID=1123237 RepID=S9RQY5_9RHOB|nr:DNA helicase IV [Salipiger mucosus DSM 16094]
MKKGLLSSSLSLDLGGGGNLTLPAVDASAARTFAEAVTTAWTNFNWAELQKEDAAVRRILHTLDALKVPDVYPAACHVAPLARDAADLNSRVLSKLNAEAVGNEVMSRIAPIVAFAADPNTVRDAAIETFVEAQLLRWKDFFDTVESMPLTPEQRLSVVVDEDATLVLAGAGSGKTSVITAKAAYLVKAEIRKPSELLLLAFAKDAATEMSERIEARCGVPVAARTFHALAYEIIGEVEGEKPPLAPTATDDKAFLSLMKEILRHIVATASDIAQTVIGWFAGFFDDFPTEWDFKTKHEWYAQIESRNLRTLQGETVNSFEELLIANWLFRNGIAYEYEPNYEHKLQKTGRRVYTPDFRLIESGAYIEHFGVRKKRGRDGKEELTTAPYIDRDEYLEGMDWKRQVHAEHETILVETYSWEREEGRLLEALGKVRQLLLQFPVRVRLGQSGDQRHGRDEEHGIARHDHLPAYGDSKVGLAHPGRPKQEHGLAVRYEAPGGQVANLSLVDRRLGLKVEAGEIPHEGEAGQAEAHLDPPLILAGYLPLAEQRQSLSDRHLTTPGLVEEPVELVADRGQLEPCQHPLEMVRGLEGHHQAPPATASYSLRGRRSSGDTGASSASVCSPALVSGPPVMPSKWVLSTIRARRPGLSRWHATS